MAPKSNFNELNYISTLKTLHNIFNKLQSIANQKQNFILSQNWIKLNELSLSQEELNHLLNKNLSNIEKTILKSSAMKQKN